MIYDYKGVPLRELKGKAKLQYIWDYYKFGICAVLLVLIILLSALHRHFTHKDTVLGLALVNVILSEQTLDDLKEDYLAERNIDPKHNQIDVTANLTVTRSADNSAAFDYASEVKLLAMITAKQLDVVFLDETALEVFTKADYIDTSVSLEGTEFASKVGLEGSAYAAVIGNSDRIDEARSFIDYIIQ